MGKHLTVKFPAPPSTAGNLLSEQPRELQREARGGHGWVRAAGAEGRAGLWGMQPTLKFACGIPPELGAEGAAGMVWLCPSKPLGSAGVALRLRMLRWLDPCAIL